MGKKGKKRHGRSARSTSKRSKRAHHRRGRKRSPPLGSAAIVNPNTLPAEWREDENLSESEAGDYIAHASDVSESEMLECVSNMMRSVNVEASSGMGPQTVPKDTLSSRALQSLKVFVPASRDTALHPAPRDDPGVETPAMPTQLLTLDVVQRQADRLYRLSQQLTTECRKASAMNPRPIIDQRLLSRVAKELETVSGTLRDISSSSSMQSTLAVPGIPVSLLSRHAREHRGTDAAHDSGDEADESAAGGDDSDSKASQEGDAETWPQIDLVSLQQRSQHRQRGSQPQQQQQQQQQQQPDQQQEKGPGDVGTRPGSASQSVSGDSLRGQPLPHPTLSDGNKVYFYNGVLSSEPFSRTSVHPRHGNHTLARRRPNFCAVASAFQDFLHMDHCKILVFPPMPRSVCKKIDSVAKAFKLEVCIRGKGKSRTPVVTKTNLSWCPPQVSLDSLELAWELGDAAPPLHSGHTSRRSSLPGFVGADATPIGHTNIGHKLMRQMGWDPGSGLGPTGSGVTEPVAAQVRKGRRGLGGGDMGVDDDTEGVGGGDREGTGGSSSSRNCHVRRPRRK